MHRLRGYPPLARPRRNAAGFRVSRGPEGGNPAEARIMAAGYPGAKTLNQSGRPPAGGARAQD
eukprot:7818751-Alexandrium_andersonii.AAC.1